MRVAWKPSGRILSTLKESTRTSCTNRPKKDGSVKRKFRWPNWSSTAEATQDGDGDGEQAGEDNTDTRVMLTTDTRGVIPTDTRVITPAKVPTLIAVSTVVLLDTGLVTALCRTLETITMGTETVWETVMAQQQTTNWSVTGPMAATDGGTDGQRGRAGKHQPGCVALKINRLDHEQLEQSI
ncbi:hypothetical protein DPEC_G00069910 [Dallia pectoralis]|uniref:Uncharacterized protein n=1 Tax=Dallia pectoralis TaxID=75939 RepID=A0ACC2H259_DALPE|nr:hypothetical protein DPEC_G00069910 [Dallia pectoralis]